MEETNLVPLDGVSVDLLCQKILTHIDQAQNNVQRTIDTEMVKAY